MSIKTVATNRKAFHNYHVQESLEAGIALTGSEIKSIRAGRVSLGDAYIRPEGGELWLADAVDRLAARACVVAQPIDGLWMAAGDPLRQLKACVEMSLRREDTRDDLVAYLRSLEF